MKTVDTKEYISMLRTLIEEGKQVSMIISGSSMAPFLIHARDHICLKSPSGELRKGDMVSISEATVNMSCTVFIMLKMKNIILSVTAQTVIEGPIQREQIFAIIIKVKRKGKWIVPEDFQWKFFAHIWPNIILYAGPSLKHIVFSKDEKNQRIYQTKHKPEKSILVPSGQTAREFNEWSP